MARAIKNQCPVCETPASVAGQGPFNGYYEVQCPRCGVYFADASVLELGWGDFDVRVRRRVSSWIRDTQPTNCLSEEALRQATAVRQPDFVERSNRLLLALAGQASGEFEVDGVRGPAWESIAWSSGPELSQLIEYLSEVGYVEWAPKNAHIRIRPKGMIHLDALRQTKGEGDTGFVAMWFGPEVDPLWIDAIEPAIRAAGYQPLRIDKAEYEGRVDDEIIASIRRSRFLVADLTGSRGGVYFEAGLAIGLGMPVYWTCRADEMERVHFDANHYRFTLWAPEALEDFAGRLRQRIEADIGPGPWKRPTGQSS